MIVLVIAAILASPVMLMLMYSRCRHRYWARRGVPVPPDYWPIFGHTCKFFSSKEQSWEFLDRAYRYYRGSTFCGTYDLFSPELIVGDPDLVNNILIKDFDHFVDRLNNKSCIKMDEVFKDMLTNATGAHWKGIRSALSPCFTSGQMEGMFPLVVQKVDVLIQALHERIKVNSVIEVRKQFENYTLDVISSCVFGMETNARHGNSEFNIQAAEIFNTDLRKIIKGVMFHLFSESCKSKEKDLKPKEIFYFKDLVMDSMKRRRRAGSNRRGDFLDLMMETGKDQLDPYSTTPKYPLDDNTIVAQSLVFLLGGFDTISTTLSFTTFLLAKYPEKQRRLRDEMSAIAKRDGNLTYQGIMEAKYLDAVISETLRMYGPIPATDRKCTKDYNLPGTDIIIPKDMVVIVPIYSIHHDKRFWPEPKEFCPERFLPENKVHIRSGTYLPFGTGSRSCIGMRFGLMKTKLAIAKIVLEFNLSCIPGQEEVRLSKIPGNIRPADDLSVIFTPRK